MYLYVYRERSESHNAKLQRKLEKMSNETEYTLQESKSTVEALEQTREINQKVYFVYKLGTVCLAFVFFYKHHDTVQRETFTNP